MPLDRAPQAELINVHKVYGYKDLVNFLKNSAHEFTESLFYASKRTGRAEFYYKNEKYLILRQDDGSFVISKDEEQNYSTEQFS